MLFGEASFPLSRPGWQLRRDAWLQQPMSVDVTHVTGSRAATVAQSYLCFHSETTFKYLLLTSSIVLAPYHRRYIAFLRGRKPSGKGNQPLSAFVIEGSTNTLARIIMISIYTRVSTRCFSFLYYR
jgi:hypothetical protein